MARRRNSEERKVHLQHSTSVVWIPRAVLDRCTHEAAAFYPRETGGTFMGYWCDGTEVVITGLIGAGPAARHRLTSFEPDQKWQLQEIKRHYIASGRREGYLGDWHTHPDAASGELSITDRAVLARIIASPKARAPCPISMVFFGTRTSWKASTWLATKGRRFLWRRSISVSQALLHTYER